MSTEPLPSALDVRKAALRGARISGTLSVADLSRFAPMLAVADGEVEVTLDCFRDEDNRTLMRVMMAAEVQVSCQRCLESMPFRLASDSTLAVVWNDEQAACLPRYLDPLIVPGEDCNIYELVEEELILALPPYHYHDTDQCKQTTATFAPPAEPDSTEAPASGPGPFEVLARLKSGSDEDPRR